MNSRTTSLGSNIKKRRWEVGMEQKELAEKIGTSSAAVCQIENNKTQPQMQTLMKIAAALSCTPSDLLKGIDGKEVG